MCFRRDGRVAEGARLESVYTGNCIQGSNPCLSATFPSLTRFHSEYRRQAMNRRNVLKMFGLAAGAAAPAEEKTDFTVTLTEVGTNKINVIKVVREIVSGLGLKEAKDLVDGAPKPLLEKVAKEAAEEAKTKLEAAGATVTVK